MVIGAGPIGALIPTVGISFGADVVAAEIGPNRSAGVLLARTPRLRVARQSSCRRRVARAMTCRPVMVCVRRETTLGKHNTYAL